MAERIGVTYYQTPVPGMYHMALFYERADGTRVHDQEVCLSRESSF